MWLNIPQSCGLKVHSMNASMISVIQLQVTMKQQKIDYVIPMAVKCVVKNSVHIFMVMDFLRNKILVCKLG